MGAHREIHPQPERLGVDPARLNELGAAAEGLVGDDALPSVQIALARADRVAALCTFGEVPSGNDTLYCAFSTTKAVTASAVWILIQEGRLGLDERVADAIPEFAGNGKQDVRVEHLLTHTAGFPNAPFEPLEWDDRDRRLARFAAWRLEWEPGSRFVYHPTSGMWVLAELVERRSGVDFRAFVRERIARPLGLERFHVGLPRERNASVADVVHVGEAIAPESLEAAGLRLPRELLADEGHFEVMNRPDVRAVGIPGGGGILNAADLALFYQALLHDGRSADGAQVWKPDVLRAARRIHTGDLRDPMTGARACRGLGLVIAGDDERVFRAFAPNNSPEAFGHPGAGCQVAWADPASGVSFVLLTNGLDRNPLRMGARGLRLSRLAASCALA